MERSRLTEEDVRNLKKKYDLSSFSAQAAGEATASNPPPEHIVIYEHTLSDGVSLGSVGKSVGQTNGQEDSSLEGEEVEFTEDGNFIRSRKRRFSEVALKEAAEEPAHGIAKIHSCSNISSHDVEGDNVERYGVLGQMPSGGVAGTPITPLGENFSQNLPAVGEGTPAEITSLVTDMGKITTRVLSSVMSYEQQLTKLREALNKKTEECQAWEQKFNMSKKDHALTLLKLLEESEDKLKRLQEQKEESERKLKEYLKERVQGREEYEKLLKNQKSEIELLKEQNEKLDAALNDLEKARSLLRK